MGGQTRNIFVTGGGGDGTDVDDGAFCLKVMEDIFDWTGFSDKLDSPRRFLMVRNSQSLSLLDARDAIATSRLSFASIELKSDIVYLS